MEPPSPGDLQSRLAELEQQLALTRDALRRSEAFNRESREYFTKSFFSNPAVMTIASAVDGRLIEVNTTFLQSTGYSREEIIGRSTLELGLWLKPAQRDQFLERVRTERQVRDFEAEFRMRDGTSRDVLLTADLIEVDGQPCMLTVALDITDRRRRERVQEATYQISRVFLSGGNLTALFAELHRIIGTLMSARNFYVALMSQDRSLLTFPYFVDETSPPPPPRKPGRGFTEYVLDTGRALLANAEGLAEIIREDSRYTPLGQPAKLWLGAPLIIDQRTIGVIAVQDYHNATAFGEEEKRLLTFVADQAALAVQRRQADEARRESAEYFTKSFNASPALMAIVSLESNKVLEANEAFLRTAGWTRAEVLGRTSLDLGIWPRAEDRRSFMERLKSTGSVRDYEATFYTKARQPRYVSLNVDVIELNGRPCMLITAMDLTDRHRRERFQAATYAISQSVLGGRSLDVLFAELHRIIGGLMSARNFYVALISADGTELTFPYFVDEFVPEAPSRAPANGFTEYIINNGKPAMLGTAELEAVLSRLGPYQPLEKPAAQRLGAPLIIDGRTIGVIAVQDYDNPQAFGEEELRLLTFVADQAALAVQRRQAEEALTRAERQYRGIFENALEGIYQATPDGRFLRANAALARILGYSSPFSLMVRVTDIGRQIYADPNRRDEFLKLIKDTDVVPEFESDVVRADGTIIRLSESVRVVRDEQGRISHFEGVAADVTAAREAARVLSEARDAADAANRAKSQFLASMSHELRTPLNGILGYTQILGRDGTLTPKQRDGISIIHQSADHLLALINDVLDLAKIEASKLEFHPVDFDLADFVRSLTEIFIPRAREKNLLLETSFSPDLPEVVRADTQRLRQVLLNLISNAIKFTREGGVIFSIERAGEALRFSVSDSGPGIRPEDLPRLFEPFAQLGDVEQRTTGTGLGLNVSRNILEQMGSTLQVDSRPGRGTRFWFELRLPEAAASARVPSAPSPRRVTGYTGPRRHVLVVDDHEANRRLLCDLLEPLGFTTATAADGGEAIKSVQNQRPDLILMDLRMPQVDGLAASRTILDQSGDQPPCIIGISASTQNIQRLASFEAGCTAFLSKPFREEELFQLMEKHLGLAWIESTTPSKDTASPFPHLPFAPASEDIDVLFDLASKGDVLAVRDYAHQLASRDARLAPFAQAVTDLAARFKMKAIRQFLARYRSVSPSPNP